MREHHESCRRTDYAKKRGALDAGYFCGAFALALQTGHPLKSTEVNGVLLRAAYCGDVSLVQQCFAEGASIWHVDESGRTALHAAAAGSHSDVIGVLLAACDTDSVKRALSLRDYKGWTPLHVAICKDREGAVEAFLKAGADPHVLLAHNSAPCRETPTHSAAIHFTAMRCNSQILTMLLTLTTSQLTDKDAASRVPLHYAAARGKATFVQELITLCPDTVQAEDCHRRTPLHAAAMQGSLEVVRLLLGHGADPHTRDIWDADAATLAALHGHDATAAVLKEACTSQAPESRGALERHVIGVLNASLRDPNKEQVERCVRRLGCDACLELLEKTLQIQNAGGESTKDGSRKRTAGGVFFNLVQAAVRERKYTPEDWTYITMATREKARAARKRGLQPSRISHT